MSWHISLSIRTRFKINSNLLWRLLNWGRDESVRRGAGSQWIVAARPLCHLQCPVAYLSRLQRIQPAGRLEFRSKGAPRLLCRAGRGLRHVPVGAQAPLLWVGRQPTGAGAASLAWILT